MQYLYLLYSDEAQDTQPATPADWEAYMAPWVEYDKKLTEAGVLRGGNALEPSHTATTLSPGPKEPVMTDGPFAETKEQIGGYYLVECANLDDALAWASKCPVIAMGGRVEVRPIMDLSGPG